MSSTEEIETKAGHPPALKVGGKRIPNRVRKNSEDVTEKSAQDLEDEEEFPETKNGKQPQLVMWGQVRDPNKDYPSQAVQSMQKKPVPTHEQSTKPASARPSIIQQPRK